MFLQGDIILTLYPGVTQGYCNRRWMGKYRLQATGYVCIKVYMYVMHICIFACMCMYVCTYACINECKHVIYTYMCVAMYMYVCVCTLNVYITLCMHA